MKLLRFRTALLLTLVAGLLPTGCGDSSSDAELAGVVTFWNTQALIRIRENSTNPPVASWQMAILHAAMFDAIVAITQTHTHYHWTPDEPSVTIEDGELDTYLQLTAATAAYRALSIFYPDDIDTLNSAYAVYQVSDPTPTNLQAINWATEAVDSLFEARKYDDGDEDPPVERPADGPGVWEKTPPKFGGPLLPSWGLLTPFTMTSPSQFRADGPPQLSSQEWVDNYNEVKALGAKAGSTRTADQSEIAQFWADGAGTVTPPGHWNQIAQDIVSQRQLGLIETARLFALLNLAMADSSISAWDMKFVYWFWRPLTAIHFDDGNPNTSHDNTWDSFITTPPFPDYVSGHSTFSGAASRMLALVFGSDAISFSTTSDDMPGVVRNFTSFSQAAEEAGKSRIYGGIHYEFANQDGLTAGRAISDQAYATYLLPK